MNRNQRTRIRNRGKLLLAAQSIIIESGIKMLNPRKITEKADLGLGTFYNHFKTIEDVVNNIIELIIQHHFLETIDYTRGLSDPAEIFAFATRFSLGKFLDSEDWRRLVLDSGIWIEKLFSAIVQRALEIIQRGISTGRFKVDQIDLLMSMLRGSGIMVAIDMRNGDLAVEMEKEFTIFYLKMLGIEKAEAIDICSRPLPPFSITKPPLKLLDEKQTALLKEESLDF